MFLLTNLSPARDFKPRIVNNYKEIDFYLHTVEVGNLVFNNFGHTAIRLVDKRNGDDFVFNWGIFDFSHPVSFSYKFFKGVLIYKLGAYPTRFAHRIYKWEQRTVWEDKLNLTPDQKKILYERISWHLKPENISYPYQYFFDNCSTRPRDFIDEALNGSVKALTENQSTHQTFRDMWRLS